MDNYEALVPAAQAEIDAERKRRQSVIARWCIGLISIPVIMYFMTKGIVIALILLLPLLIACALITPEIASFFSDLITGFTWKSRPPEEIPIYSTAEALAMNGKYVEAEAEYEKIMGRFPKETKPHVDLMKMAVTRLNDGHLAEQYYQRGLSMLSDPSSREVLTSMHYALWSMLKDPVTASFAQPSAPPRPAREVQFTPMKAPATRPAGMGDPDIDWKDGAHTARWVIAIPCIAVPFLLSLAVPFAFLLSYPVLLLGCILIAPDIAGKYGEMYGSILWRHLPAKQLPNYSIPQSKAAMGNYERAVEEYEAIMVDFPDEIKPHTDLIHMAVVKMNDLDLAKQFYERGVKYLAYPKAKKALKELYEGILTLQKKPAENLKISPDKIIPVTKHVIRGSLDPANMGNRYSQ